MPIEPKITKSSNKPDSIPTSIWHRDISTFLRFNYTPRAPLRDISVFSRKLSFLLGAGIPIKSAISIVSEQLPGRGLRKQLLILNAKVQQGESFSAAIKATGAFPAFFSGSVSIGEATAKLPQVMEQLADFYDEQAQTKDELTAALVYPVAVSILMLGVIILAVTFVLPGYSRIFDATGAPMPALTRGLLQISEFLSSNAILLGIGFLSALIIMIFLFQTKKVREFIGLITLRLPLVRQGVNFRLTQSLHLLLSAGLPVSQALPLTEDVMENLWVRNDISKISAGINMGKPFWEALREISYIDPLLIGLARIGEEAGNMTKTIEQCQGYYTRAYRRSIRRINKLVEPIITLILGIGLGIIMLAVILPTFELATVL